MSVKVVLVDINPKIVKAWRQTFEENPEVEIVSGSMLDRKEMAWVTPTNSRGSMDGGLDLLIKNTLGAQIERRVQQEIARIWRGSLPVGCAICVPTGRDAPRFLISTPTMGNSSENISDKLNVALACAAAFQAVRMQNRIEPNSITSIALPGLGANTGKVPAEICADLMWTGYNLFLNNDFADFKAMRQALEAELGQLDAGDASFSPSPSSSSFSTQSPPPSFATPPKPAATPSHKTIDMDFDDSD